jgi:DNA-binding IclR family transcriptional regulator
MSGATEAYFVTRTLGVLELLATGPRTAVRLADELEIHPRTVRRILARLVHDGYATRTHGARPLYSLTPRFALLAGRALREQVRAQLAEADTPASLEEGEPIIDAPTAPDPVMRAPRRAAAP